MNINEFHTLVDETINELKAEATTSPAIITVLNTGEKFQIHVSEIIENVVMPRLGLSGSVTNKTSKVFPDIVIDCPDGTKYGIEVKSSSDNKVGWEIPGNSINESTLVPGLAEIQLIFGKTNAACLDFKSAVYADCIKEIRATHYPRYIVDMSTPSGNTIFNQMGISFEDFNQLTEAERMQKIKDFYVSQGKYYWWLSDNAETTIALFESLGDDKISYALAYGFVHFPEELSSSRKKFQRLAKYIASEYGAVSPSLRDKVTAGGRDDLKTPSRTYSSVPKIYITMYSVRKDIQNLLKKEKLTDLEKDWGYTPSARRPKSKAWIEVLNHFANNDLSEPIRTAIFEDILNTP